MAGVFSRDDVMTTCFFVLVTMISIVAHVTFMMSFKYVMPRQAFFFSLHMFIIAKMLFSFTQSGK